jgi:hypothetical protein
MNEGLKGMDVDSRSSAFPRNIHESFYSSQELLPALSIQSHPRCQRNADHPSSGILIGDFVDDENVRYDGRVK